MMSVEETNGFQEKVINYYASALQNFFDTLIRLTTGGEEFELFLAAREQYCPSKVKNPAVCQHGINKATGSLNETKSCYACLTIDRAENRVPEYVVKNMKELREQSPMY